MIFGRQWAKLKSFALCTEWLVFCVHVREWFVQHFDVERTSFLAHQVDRTIARREIEDLRKYQPSNSTELAPVRWEKTNLMLAETGTGWRLML